MSIDALGSLSTCADSVMSLRRRGTHIQVGLLPPGAGPARVPMDRVIAYEPPYSAATACPPTRTAR